MSVTGKKATWNIGGEVLARPPRVADPHRRDDRQVAARAVAAEQDAVGSDAPSRGLLDRPAVGRERVVRRRGEGVLGREPVVDREHGDVRPGAEEAAHGIPATLVAVGAGRASCATVGA